MLFEKLCHAHEIKQGTGEPIHFVSGHEFSLTLDINKLMADRNYDQIPVLKSFRLVKQQKGKIGKPIQVKIVKDREFNPFTNFSITIKFDPGKIDPAIASNDYYLYFDSHPIDEYNHFCDISEDCWYAVQDKDIKVYGGSLTMGVKAPVIYTSNGIIINKLDLNSKHTHNLYLFARNRYLKNSRQQVTFNNKTVERDFCNYNRLISLGKIIPSKDKSLKISFKHFDLLKIQAIAMVPEKTNISTLLKSIPNSTDSTDIVPRFIEHQ